MDLHVVSSWTLILSLLLLKVTIVLLLLFCVIQAIVLILLSYRIGRVPKTIPWVGLQNRRFFPKIRASLGHFTEECANLEEGYTKYTKFGLPFVLPGLHFPTIVLPPQDTAWLITQPQNVVSNNAIQDDLLGLEWLGHGPDLDAVHDFSVIRRDLTRQMGVTLPEVLDEAKYAFDEEIGTSKEWTDVSMTKNLHAAVTTTVFRIIVGPPFCRNKRFKDTVSRWSVAFALSGMIGHYLIPKYRPLQDLIMPILGLPATVLRWQASRSLSPEIKRRLEQQRLPHADNSDVLAERSNDMLQWVIEASLRSPNPAEAHPVNIAGKVILFNLFAVATIYLTLSTILVDITSCPSADALISSLRKEATTIFPRLKNEPTAVREMVKTDSVIRETLRFNSNTQQGLLREIVKPGGLTTPDGLHLPQGIHVGSHFTLMQRDPQHGKEWDEYQPLRFVDEVKDQTERRQTVAVQISDKYLSFGLGRHACPGRFFAVQTLKIILGYLLIHYDFETLPKRPEFLHLASSNVPKSDTKIRLRRRSTSEKV